MSSSLDDIRDVRHRAAAILSGAKLRQLEEAGLTVVEERWFREVQNMARQFLSEHTVVSEHYYDGTDIPIRVGDRVYLRQEEDVPGTLVRFDPEHDVFEVDWDDIGPVEYPMDCIAWLCPNTPIEE
ncbi:hypothetical protein [Alicyclobacillus sendaiensis]|uniref:Uncharacterized protein n=1 Tax=Alicyclobacillus sendaiensis PA2 TaxID=3029425 RepID=A0ABT6Y1N3_ALISE|nr:hypothetical protein [Alicyclobacillus sendaiensis]MDI9261230.1 hypothetical protein [Alicyclobacillus sendaiensis PA2]